MNMEDIPLPDQNQPVAPDTEPDLADTGDTTDARNNPGKHFYIDGDPVSPSKFQGKKGRYY